MERLQKARANVAVAYPIATLIALLPALLLLGHRALLRLRSGGAAAGDGDGVPPSPPSRTILAPTASILRSDEASKATASKLRAARRSAAQRRLLVSGAMLHLGWALVVFGCTPFIMLMIGRRSTPSWAPLCTGPPWPAGRLLLGLALLPTDARAIRTVCAVFFAFFLSLGLYSYPSSCSYP